MHGSENETVPNFFFPWDWCRRGVWILASPAGTFHGLTPVCLFGPLLESSFLLSSQQIFLPLPWPEVSFREWSFGFHWNLFDEPALKSSSIACIFLSGLCQEMIWLQPNYQLTPVCKGIDVIELINKGCGQADFFSCSLCSCILRSFKQEKL